MWILHPKTGGVVLVTHEAHIARLLDEGGREVPDPTITQIEAVVNRKLEGDGQKYKRPSKGRR
jgi:hypothetical protein